MKRNRYVILLIIISTTLFCIDSYANTADPVLIKVLSSPDKKIVLRFFVDSEKQARYSIQRNGKIVLQNSKLGLIRTDENFTRSLTLVSSSAIFTVKDKYTLKTGKKSVCYYTAQKQVFHLKNESGKKLDLIFQVSNDGVAYRYYFPDAETGIKKITAEISSFNFSANTKAWLQPMQEAKTGWESTNPAYEEYYKEATNLTQLQPAKAGWVFPALFQSDDSWLLVTEAAVGRKYCASRLINEAGTNEFRIGFPDSKEHFMNGAVTPESELPWYSPWRIITVGSLQTIMESTLGTDLAIPSLLKDTTYIKPGIASWSWILKKDRSIVLDVQKKYIDFAARMKYQYCLIDVNWDRTIGYEKMKELSAYAKDNNVGLWLWYNSSGDWNTTKYTPKSKLITHENRIREFSLLQQMGVKGIKVDFFGGDGQSVMNYYEDILTDAAAYNLMVNCHGATLPRGLQRTYPNFLTAEAVRGEEMVSFFQDNANTQAVNCTLFPFTRNVFDPMDFTPMVLHELPGIKRKTTSTYELALSIVFISGVQHLAEGPEGMEFVPGYVQTFLQQLPVSWDETRFLDGYPGKLYAVARRSGKKWYIAVINGENTNKEINLNLSFLKNKKTNLIADETDGKSFLQIPLQISSDGKVTVAVKANGGIVCVID